MNRAVLGIVGLLLVALPLLWLGQKALDPSGNSPTWTEFKAGVQAGDFAEVVLAEDEVRARKSGKEGPLDWVRVVRVDDPNLLGLLEAKNVPYRQARPSACSEGAVMMFVIPVGVLVLMWVFIGRQVSQSGRSAAAFGRSGANLAPEEGTGVTFSDVAGVDESKSKNSRKSSSSSRIPASSRGLAGASRRACCSWGLPAPARRCSRAP
jgi:cell division protease FtsH